MICRGSEYIRVLNMPLVLNMRGSEYTRILNMPLVLNIPEFLNMPGLHRVLDMPELYQDMPEYV